jgi:hypothetical protein
MNVIKALNNNRYVDSVEIFVKSIEVKNPCNIVIETDFVEGLFNRSIRPESISNIRFNLLSQHGENFCIIGVKSISSSRTVNPSYLFSDKKDILFNDRTNNRKITLDLINPLEQEDLNRLIRTFNVTIDIEHYSFRQEYNL